MVRLVPLLAVGPGLIALALATASRAQPEAIYVPTTLPSGATIMKIITPEETAMTNATWSSELSLGSRLASALMLVMTILAHGAAIVSVGVLLGIAIKRRSWAVAVSACVFVFIGLAWPVPVLRLLPDTIAQGVSALSPVSVVGFLMINLMTREPQFPDMVWWAAFWNVLVSLVAFELLWHYRTAVAPIAGLRRSGVYDGTGQRRGSGDATGRHHRILPSSPGPRDRGPVA
jgi:hypothetical protein